MFFFKGWCAMNPPNKDIIIFFILSYLVVFSLLLIKLPALNPGGRPL